MQTPAGFNWIVGGLTAAVLLPLLAVGLGAPFVVAASASALAGAGLVVLLAPRRPLENFDGSGVARSRIELVRELLTDAAPMAERLDRSARQIKATKVGDRVRHLATVARGILAAIEKDPLRIDRVRRFLTYYLPRTTEIAEAYIVLEQGVAPDAKRLAATETLLDRLDSAFTRYAASLQDADLDKLDIELKLLKSSLDDDLGPQGAAVAVPSGRAKGDN